MSRACCGVCAAESASPAARKPLQPAARRFACSHVENRGYDGQSLRVDRPCTVFLNVEGLSVTT